MTTAQIATIWARIVSGEETAWEADDVYLALEIRQFSELIEQRRV